MLGRSGGTAVPHGRQHRQHKPLQERGLALSHPVQHLGGHRRVRLIHRGRDRLTRSRPVVRMIIVTIRLRRTGAALEIDELREPGQHLQIDPAWMLRGHLLPAVGDTDHAALGAAEQAGLVHVGDRPVQPVGDIAAALDAYTKVLPDLKRVLGPENPKVAMAQDAITNLGEES